MGIEPTVWKRKRQFKFMVHFLTMWACLTSPDTRSLLFFDYVTEGRGPMLKSTGKHCLLVFRHMTQIWHKHTKEEWPKILQTNTIIFEVWNILLFWLSGTADLIILELNAQGFVKKKLALKKWNQPKHHLGETNQTNLIVIPQVQLKQQNYFQV